MFIPIVTRKLFFIPSVVVLTVILAIVVAASSSGPIAGLTGAPSEYVCADCHADAAPNTGSGSMAITAPALYVPGESYTIEVEVQHTGQSRWGFQITALDASNQMAGSFTITQPLTTQSNFNGYLSRSYVNHKSAGTYAGTLNGPVSWEMTWNAPATGVGPVTFYAATVAANNNGDPTGDSVYTATATTVIGDTTKFFSFTPDSLIEKKPVKKSAVSSSFCASFVNTTGVARSDLEIKFGGEVVLTSYGPMPTATSTDGGITWMLSGQSIAPGDSVTVCGDGSKSGSKVTKWRYAGSPLPAYQPGFTPSNQIFHLPMPNAANFRMEVFANGGFAPGTGQSDSMGGMVIGRSFIKYVPPKWKVDSDSAKKYGWVRLKKHGDLQKSLEPGRSGQTHTGSPKGFCVFDNGREFIKQQNNLPAVKQSNQLFAELLAVKMNIVASAMEITPIGFGELKYIDNGHPLDSMMVKNIAKLADSLMTYCAGTDTALYYMLDSVLQKVNAAFSDDIDTISFGTSLKIKGSKAVGAVEYLYRDPGVVPTRINPILVPEYEEGDEEEDGLIPNFVAVAQNYPNPFNPSTTIRFEVVDDAFVTLKVYNLLGQDVGTILDREWFPSGMNEAVFDASRLASGVYFYRVVAEPAGADGTVRYEKTGKMILLR